MSEQLTLADIKKATKYMGEHGRRVKAEKSKSCCLAIYAIQSKLDGLILLSCRDCGRRLGVVSEEYAGRLNEIHKLKG